MSLNPTTPTPPEATPGQILGRCGRLLLAVLLLLPPNVWAATFTASNDTELRDAINDANDESVTGYPGPDIINLTADITLYDAPAGYDAGGKNGLPPITSDITVRSDLSATGAPFTIDRDSTVEFRFFFVQPNGKLRLEDVTLDKGQQGGGGALRTRGLLTLTNTTVTRSIGTQRGGGIYVASGADTMISYSEISFNEANLDGGGIYIQGITVVDPDPDPPVTIPGGSLMMVNSTISKNLAKGLAGRGGGLFVFEPGTADLLHTTMSGNYAYDGGQSIFVFDPNQGPNLLASLKPSKPSAKNGVTPSPVSLTNSVVGNRTIALDHCDGTFTVDPLVADGGNNWAEDDSCNTAFGTLTGLDPNLRLNNNLKQTRTHALLCGSSAIDKAGNCHEGPDDILFPDGFGIDYDQRGKPRPFGPACDSGSFELQEPVTGIGNLYPIALSEDTLAGKDVGDELIDVLSGEQPGNFGWLTWTGDPSVPALTTSLTPPGDSDTYVNPQTGELDTVTVGDWVEGSPGVSNASDIRALLQDLIDTALVITVPVWSTTELQGNNTYYVVSSFAKIKITHYHLPKDNMISATYEGPAEGGCE